MIYDPEWFNDLRMGKHKISFTICHRRDVTCKKRKTDAMSHNGKIFVVNESQIQSCFERLELIAVQFIIDSASCIFMAAWFILSNEHKIKMYACCLDGTALWIDYDHQARLQLIRFFNWNGFFWAVECAGSEFSFIDNKTEIIAHVITIIKMKMKCT